MAEKIAVYPGTFDPITLGHLGVIEESLKIFKKVIVGLLVNTAKNPRFTEEERKSMAEESIADAGIDNVEVKTFKGLAVELARQEKAIAMIRGLRLTTEYEAELNLALNNRIIGPDIITVLIPPRQEHLHISSTVVKELLKFGHSEIDGYVPRAVLEHVGIMEERYKARILETCRHFVVAQNTVLARYAYRDIVARYQSPRRLYHTLKHINDCLNEFEAVKSFVAYRDAVELAILCHDAVYDTRRKDNEEISGEFAKEIIKVLNRGIDEDRVAELIIYTKHDVLPSNVDLDAQFLVDIDLASLGYSEREFDKNTAKIRKEFAWVPEEKFNTERVVFFKTLLPPNRATIYLTQFFRDKYEAQAQKNIARAITQLSK